jgi:hypothetical protein
VIKKSCPFGRLFFLFYLEPIFNPDMKPIILCSLSLLLVCRSWSQDHQTQKKTLSRHLREVYDVPKKDWKTKDGPYFVINDDGVKLVKGAYDNGKKSGVWSFLNAAGDVLQKYDFSHDSLLYSAVDSGSIVHTDFQILEFPANDNDKIQAPYKIGGSEYGFYLIFDDRDIPADVKSATSTASMTYVLTISAKGELEGYTLLFSGSVINDKVIHRSTRGLPADALEFSPAKINGVGVRSKLTYMIPLNVMHVDVPGENYHADHTKP